MTHSIRCYLKRLSLRGLLLGSPYFLPRVDYGILNLCPGSLTTPYQVLVHTWFRVCGISPNTLPGSNMARLGLLQPILDLSCFHFAQIKT